MNAKALQLKKTNHIIMMRKSWRKI